MNNPDWDHSFSYALSVLGVVLFIGAIAPFGMIWGLNTLVPSLEIPVNIRTWFACWAIALVLRGGR